MGHREVVEAVVSVGVASSAYFVIHYKIICYVLVKELLGFGMETAIEYSD